MNTYTSNKLLNPQFHKLKGTALEISYASQMLNTSCAIDQKVQRLVSLIIFPVFTPIP